MSKPASRKPESDAIVRQAAEWRARHDAGLAAGEEAAFLHWLEQDPRHAEFFVEMEATWSVLDRAREVSPGELGMPAPRSRTVAFGRGIWSPWVLAAAALALGAILWWRPLAREPAVIVARAEVGLTKRLDLTDGSIVRLNSGSEVSIAFTSEERQVRLVRGEAHFEVAKDSSRPFVVAVPGVKVRAVGTAFRVVLRPESVEVLVTEGEVRVAEASEQVSLLGSPAAAGEFPTQPSPVLAAGQRVVIAVPESTKLPRPAPARDVPPEEVAQALAWQQRRLEFDGAPLATIVREFNRYNLRQLKIATNSPDLATLRLGGSFRADDPETFVELLKTRSGIVVESEENAWMIRASR